MSTFSTLSIGIGGMVGGGIFAVTGLTIQLTRGSAPLAFLIAGIVALLTSYSYLKLTLRYPGEGGTVEFLNRAFGGGVLTGAANILLLLSYVVLVAVYAYAFGSYGASFFPEEERELWTHVLISGIVLGLLVLNILAADQVVRTENFFNATKMLLLCGFIVIGLLMPMEWTRMAPDQFVTPVKMIAGSMLIFLNYEGFELIANASKQVANPRKSLPVAYVGGVILVMGMYMLIVTVVVGHLDFDQVAASSDQALSAAAAQFVGRYGAFMVVVAALLATSSAINATFYGTGRLAYILAKSGELPRGFEREYRNQHVEGTLITAVLALLVANFVPLEAIATMGSAGFLLIFTAVNVANCILAKQTGSRVWLSGAAALSTGFALVVLCIEVDEDPTSRGHLWILAGMIVLSFAVELVYRTITGREYKLADPPGEGSV